MEIPRVFMQDILNNAPLQAKVVDNPKMARSFRDTLPLHKDLIISPARLIYILLGADCGHRLSQLRAIFPHHVP